MCLGRKLTPHFPPSPCCFQPVHRLEFVAAGCNRTHDCADWGENGLIAYGAGNSVVIYDVKNTVALCTLPGHTARINTVKFCRLGDGSDIILTGSTDKTIRVWSQEGEDWTEKSVLKGHDDTVTVLDVVAFGEHVFIASAGADSTVRLWHAAATGCDFALMSTYTIANRKFYEAISIAHLPDTNEVIVAGGGVDNKVHLFLYNYQTNNNELTHVLALDGHEDWIRAVSFAYAPTSDGSLLLATASHDEYIRLTKIQRNKDDVEVNTSGVLGDSSIADFRPKARTFQSSGDSTPSFTVYLEAVLTGHEGKVSSLAWKRPVDSDQGCQPLSLLSSSMDRTMIVWSPDEQADGMWVSTARMGEMGGNTLGFYGGLFSPSGTQVLAHNYTGAFHLWTQSSEEATLWSPTPVISGHFGAVKDVTWSADSQYLTSVSLDQTSRVYAPVTFAGYQGKWLEVARPQVHGYDIICGVNVPSKVHTIVTGSDEKILRVFEAPKTFTETLKSICGITTQDPSIADRPLLATLPELGLSNKAEGTEEVSETSAPVYQPDHIPYEEDLIQSTLWSETQKLYGHPNELLCVAVNDTGSLIASACKASQESDATIRLWDTDKWLQQQELVSHTLSVVQLSFAPSCPNSPARLLSASRDRSFSLFQRDGSTQQWSLVAKVEKAHARIVWSCTWAPDCTWFATASRDKKVKLWKTASLAPNTSPVTFTLPTFPAAVTAVAARTHPTRDGMAILAVGLEDGGVRIFSVTLKSEEDEWQVDEICQVSRAHAPTATVSRLAWRAGEGLFLAVASMDNSVRLLSFHHV
eukprot:TRINITY_DN3338_c0_g2_i2.p1 TRINITY_DN3338_c0_g2~~TRINITY_DN3338_c0_g2_i2.p1  ORF type:complete len:807 (+),score=134.55 TRINITY_DN3338_c0_g2_i2:171-2591(+)